MIDEQHGELFGIAIAMGRFVVRHIGVFAPGMVVARFQNLVRLRNYADTSRYCDLLEASQLPIDSSDVLTPLDRAGEIAAFGLRMLIGWSFQEFLETTGYDLRDHWSEAMAHLVDRGWAVATESDFRLTPTGLRFADAAAQYFLQPASSRRDAGS